MLAGFGRLGESPDQGICNIHGNVNIREVNIFGKHVRLPPCSTPHSSASPLHSAECLSITHCHGPFADADMHNSGSMFPEKKKFVVKTYALARFSSLRSIRAALLGTFSRITRESADRHSPRSMICAWDMRDETGLFLREVWECRDCHVFPFSLVVLPTLHRRLSQYTLRLACESSILSLLSFGCQIADFCYPSSLASLSLYFGNIIDRLEHHRYPQAALISPSVPYEP